MKKQVVLLSDTHGVLDQRIAALVAASDIAVHAGDIGSQFVLHALQPKDSVIAVRGNNDVAHKWPVEGQHLLEHLPAEAAVDLPGGQLIVLHSEHYPVRRRHARLRAAYPHARAVVYGHSHLLAVDCTALPWILNPGAAGRERTHGGPSCLILIAADNDWRIDIRRYPLPPSAKAASGSAPLLLF